MGVAAKKKKAVASSSSDSELDVDEDIDDLSDSDSDSDSGSGSDSADEAPPPAAPKKKPTASPKKKKKIVDEEPVTSSDDDDDDDDDSSSDDEDEKKTTSPVAAAKKPRLTKKRVDADKMMSTALAAISKKRSIAEAAALSSEDEDEDEDESSGDDTAAAAAPEDEDEDEDEDDSEPEDAAASSKKGEEEPAATADDDRETAIKDVHRGTTLYVARIDGNKEVRAVAARRSDLFYGDDEHAKVVLDHEDDYLQDTVLLVMPGDVADAVGVENGIVKARNLSRNEKINAAKRLIDIGLRRSGTMVFPPGYVFQWIRSLESAPEEDIARVERALADPSVYEEVNRSKMHLLGPAKVSRVNPVSKHGKKKRRHGKTKSAGASKKRKADTEAGASGAARSPFKRGRVEGGSGELMAVLNAFGHFLVQSTEQFDSDE